jgi:translation initiation factor eIF-2B subunit gamma
VRVKINFDCSVKHSLYSPVLNPDGTALSQSLAMQHSTLRGEGLESRPSSTRSFARPSDTVRSMPTSPTGPDAFEGDPASLRIGFVIHRAKDGFAARVNNVHVYLETNRHVGGVLPVVIWSKRSYVLCSQFLSQPTYALQSDPVTRSLIDQKAQISADSMIGDSTRIGEKTNVKKSVIGRHCVVGKMVKLSGCVIMDHCVVADG